MRRVLTWAGIALGSLAGLLLIAAVTLNAVGSAKLRKTRTVAAEPITIPTDSAGLARGELLVRAICVDCHATDLSGKLMAQDPVMGTIYASNITGLAGMRTDADLVRAIRHAVAPDGRDLAVMPAEAFIYFSAEDLGAVIGYLKTIERRGNPRPAPALAFAGTAMLGAGILGSLFPASYIDHATPFPAMPALGANTETGEYYVRLCWSCHGADLAGGPVPDPASPPAPGLAGVRDWTPADWETFSASGLTPDGRQIDSLYMPWTIFGRLPAEEMRGLYLYLHSRP